VALTLVLDGILLLALGECWKLDTDNRTYADDSDSTPNYPKLLEVFMALP